MCNDETLLLGIYKNIMNLYVVLTPTNVWLLSTSIAERMPLYQSIYTYSIGNAVYVELYVCTIHNVDNKYYFSNLITCFEQY